MTAPDILRDMTLEGLAAAREELYQYMLLHNDDILLIREFAEITMEMMARTEVERYEASALTEVAKLTETNE